MPFSLARLLSCPFSARHSSVLYQSASTLCPYPPTLNLYHMFPSDLSHRLDHSQHTHTNWNHPRTQSDPSAGIDPASASKYGLCSSTCPVREPKLGPCTEIAQGLWYREHRIRRRC